MKLEEAINQTQFVDAYHKLAINILYSSSWLTNVTSDVLKPYGISWQQFNILRILRGLKGEPASVKLLSTRMIDRMSNASRLVDKLKSKGLVDRVACAEDRRCVEIFLTRKGLAVVDKASEEMETAITQNMNGISIEDASKCSDILDQMKG